MLDRRNEFSGIKAIVFDCDGTLLHSERAHYKAWEFALSQHGYELTKELYCSSFMGACDLAISKTMEDKIGLNCSEKLLQDMRKYFGACQKEGIMPISATLQFLTQLIQKRSSHQLKLALASGARKQEIVHNLTNLKVENSFDIVLSGVDDLAEYQDAEGTNKPKPYIYLKAAKMLGFEPHQCLAIEDSRPGVSAAVSAGCITIAVPNDFTKSQDLSHAHCKIDSFDALDFDEFIKGISYFSKG